MTWLSNADVVIVANRLPVERDPDSDEWRTSPGGLVTALEPIVREQGCKWVGWIGAADTDHEPFVHDKMSLFPVSLSEDEVEGYYEGFSNGTLWPLYHDAIVHPRFHRAWWTTYVAVNRKFAERVAEVADEGAFVWVHDYQLQLVPSLLRKLRPDVTIGFFLHIPFPSVGLFAQLPWRRGIIEGLLGANVVGFQRAEDSAKFRDVAERYANVTVSEDQLVVFDDDDKPSRRVLVRDFPISIDVQAYEALAARDDLRENAQRIRSSFGPDRAIVLGVDRLDYTKGLLHRLKAFEELLNDGELDPAEAVLVQVASPSREQVEEYQVIREEVEATVGRINGRFGTVDHTPVVYLHRGHTQEETVSLFLAADVLAVTSLRDGMNLVSKEYVACRLDDTGVLVLSEFAGAADELHESLIVNPHDIEGLKSALMRAIHMPKAEQKRRMQMMRLTLGQNDVARWADRFISAVDEMAEAPVEYVIPEPMDGVSASDAPLPDDLMSELERLASAPEIIVACDFDGTLAPIVPRPEDARILPEALNALEALGRHAGTQVVLLTGRALSSLREIFPESTRWATAGSHGAEFDPGVHHHLYPQGMGPLLDGELSPVELSRYELLVRRLNRALGTEPDVQIEAKPLGVAVHVRRVRDPERAEELLDTASAVAALDGVAAGHGKAVREFTVRGADKGSALARIREVFPSVPVLFIGDDVTDEDVFKRLGDGDVGVKVGDQPTVARHRIADPHEVVRMLETLADLRYR